MAAALCRKKLLNLCGIFHSKQAISQVVVRATQKCLYSSQAEPYEVDPERLKQIENSPSGWVPPSENSPAVPFSIRRSRLNNIPVYTDIKGGGTRNLTVIRKVKGDLEALEMVLKSKLGQDLVVQRNELTGQVKIKGNHKDSVVTILKEIGF